MLYCKPKIAPVHYCLVTVKSMCFVDIFDILKHDYNFIYLDALMKIKYFFYTGLLKDS